MKLLSTIVGSTALATAAAGVDICAEMGLSNSTSGYCNCEGATIGGNPVANIDCSIGDSSDLFYAQANVTMFPCLKTAEFQVGLSAFGTDYGTYTIEMGQTEDYEIPGMDIDIEIAGKNYTANGYLEMSMKGNAEDFTASIAIDFCTTFWGVQFCGADINPDLPYNLITGELTTTGIC